MCFYGGEDVRALRPRERNASFTAKNLESPPSLRSDLPSSLKRSARRQFGALSHSRQKHCFCVAKTLARLDRANDYLQCSAFVPNLRRVAIQTHYKNTQNCSAFVSNTKRVNVARVHNLRFSRVFKNQKRSIIINALRNAFYAFAVV